MNEILEDLIKRYPQLETAKSSILLAHDILLEAVRNGRKILVCGNGGSAADSDHIVGELMKSFRRKRDLPLGLKKKLLEVDESYGADIAGRAEGTIEAINLTQHIALSTAFSNDKDPTLDFAQEVLGYGKEGDALIAISTSGSSRNVVLAAVAAKAKGLEVISLTGERKAELDRFSSVSVKVPETETYRIQELHLPIYHALCMMLEEDIWG